MKIKLLIIITSFLIPYSALAEAFTPESNVLNVKTMFGAVGDGIANDTFAIQAALSACVLRHQTVYLPNGTYRIIDSLRMRRNDGLWGGKCSIEGESRTGTKIILLDNTPGFIDITAPKAMIIYSSAKAGSPQPGINPGGNEAFINSLYNLTIEMGVNPGAIGVSWVVSNRGTIKNVTIKGAGFVCIDHSRIYPGPGLIDDVDMEGCEIGYRQLNQLQFMTTIANTRVRTRGNRPGSAAFVLGASGLTLTNIVTIGSSPAINVTSAAGFLEVIGLKAFGVAGIPAIVTQPTSRFHVRDIVTEGYSLALRRGSVANSTLNLTSPVIERTSAPVTQLFPGPAESLRLPFETAPERYTTVPPCIVEGPSGWTSDSIDDRARIQAVLDNPECLRIQVQRSPIGVLASQIALAGPLFIPCHVRDFDMLDSFVIPASGGYATGQPMLQVIEDCHVPLTITRSWKAGTPRIEAAFIEHRSNRGLVVRDVQAGGRDLGIRTHPGSGKLWIWDYSGTIALNDTIAYALQWNPEFPLLPSTDPNAPPINMGRNVMINSTLVAIGVKTEQDQTVLELINSKAELLGIWLMPFNLPPQKIQFISTDSELTFCGVTTWTDGSKDQGAPEIIVKETRNGEDRFLMDLFTSTGIRVIDGEPVQGGTRRWVPCYTSKN